MLPFETGPMDIIDMVVVSIAFIYVIWFTKHLVTEMMEAEDE
jgi:hypothetical protein